MRVYNVTGDTDIIGLGDYHKTLLLKHVWTVDGLFVPKTFRSSYAVDVSFLGRFVPWTFRSTGLRLRIEIVV